MKNNGFFRKWAAITAVFALLLYSQPGVALQGGSSVLSLTAEEIQFIQEHPTINLGIDPEFIPYEFFDSDGIYKGIAADYLSLIAEKTGLVFEIARGLTWSQAYENAVERKLDALPCISKTAQRGKYFLFSDSYISFVRVIFVNKDNTTVNSFEDLNGKSVAVQRNSSHHSFLLDYPQIEPALFTNVEDALHAVGDGTQQAFIGNLATSNYLAKANGITNLRYIPISNQETQYLYFAVRNDWPQLVSIINKALASIDEESKMAINDRWISVEKSADYAWILRLILICSAVIALISVVSFFWIQKLRKEIHTRKKIQADLEKAKREADEANQFKTSFLTRMSHEIRTPLNGITGMAYLLRKTELTLTQKMYVDRITQSSSNMLGIINDILDFSKIEAGKVEIETASFSLDQVVQDVINIISFKIEEQKIALRLEKDPSVPNWFLGDAKRLEQILINLMNNAAKFTKEGEVSLKIRLMTKENDRYQINFAVKDTGIGMSEEQISKLFSPFIQGDISINRRFGGTGLGLSIVKNLVDLMGGDIQVFSTPGEGSTFIVQLTFPADTQKEAEYQNRVKGDQLKDIRTLVLDKNSASIGMIRNYLESFRMTCELTAAPLSALSMLQSANGQHAKPFDLLIVDYETPTENGFQFIKEIFSNPRIAHKPKVIMMLPMMREDLFDLLDEHHVDIGIGKPIVPSLLLNGILDIFQVKAVAASKTPEMTAEERTAFDKPYCVLVVEDNMTNQMIAKALLEQSGLTVMMAENGKVAVDLYMQNQKGIDLILMDLHMPVMNGYEAASEIRKISQTIPIVAMTADVVSDVKEKCDQHGIHHYLTKPFDPAHFIKTVHAVLQSASPAEPEAFRILNADVGIQNMGIGKDLYLAILNEYKTENSNTASRLQQAVKDGRFDDASSIVHKFKSSTGSIGAKPLYELSVLFQKALKEENLPAIEQMTDEFMQMLGTLFDEIQRLQNTSA